MASFRKRGELQWQARIARKGFLNLPRQNGRQEAIL